jgi:DNA-binding CsgD family transcriptional regulator
MPQAEPEFVCACNRATRGNPYLLSELLANIDQSGMEPTRASAELIVSLAPDSVLEAALTRLARLPEGTFELARAVAVLNDHAAFGTAVSLAGLDREVATRALDGLVAAELLRPGQPLAFVHPLLRSAVYAQLPPGERGEMHRLAAQLLTDTGAPVETVVAHLMAAPRLGDPWIVKQLRYAAERAVGQGAADSAGAYLARALEEPPPLDMRASVLLDLARAEALSGKVDALARLDEALELTNDAERRAEILHQLGWTLQQSGDVGGAVAAFERGLAELTGRANDDVTARLDIAYLQIGHLGAVLRDPSSAQRAQRLLADTLDKPGRDLKAHERGLLSIAVIQRLWDGHDHDEIVRLSTQVWGEGSLLEQDRIDSHTIWHVIGCLSWADALDRAEEIIEAAMESARRRGSLVTLAQGFYSRSWPRYWRGRLSAAAADAAAAVSAWSGEFSMYLPAAAYWLALAQLELGNRSAAERALDLPNAEERWANSALYGVYLAGRGAVAMSKGDREEAVRLFEAVGDSVLGRFVSNPAVVPWRSYLSSALLLSGDRGRARELAAREVELARRFGAARPLGIALRAAGMAEGGDRGIEMLTEAVQLLRRSPAKLELARALAELGAAIRRQGRPAQAREPLRQALDMARRFDAAVLTRRAYDELLATGAKPRRRHLSGADSLTPGERRVAEMAAAGLRNREIAQQLFVTVKAVQWHLGNAYRKLDIRSREGLAEALGSADRHHHLPV